MEVLAELNMPIENVIVTTDDQIFATVSSSTDKSEAKLVVLKEGNAMAWPSTEIQAIEGSYTDDRLDSPTAISLDKQGGLWVLDSGIHIGKARIWGFDISSGDLIAKLDIPITGETNRTKSHGIAVDRTNGWAYITSPLNQSIIAIHIETGKINEFSEHSSLAIDEDISMIMDNSELYFLGDSAQLENHSITLSSDGNTLFYGLETSTSWYSIPAKLLRDGADNTAIATAVERIGDKPLTNDVAIDEIGNHYFTNSAENGIDILTDSGTLAPLIRDSRLRWPNSVIKGDANALYITVNQTKEKQHTASIAAAKEAIYTIFKVNLL